MNLLKHKITIALGLVACLIAPTAYSATFTNNASIQVTSDSTSSLTSTTGTFTVSCWFRMSIPSGVTLNDNMTILMDRSDGNESSTFSYLFRYNYTNGAIEFVTHGTSGQPYSKTLIQNPYLERWYHIAMVRSGSSFTGYVDGRPLTAEGAAIGGSTAGSGLSIGGIGGTSKMFYGDVIEVARYNVVHAYSRNNIFDDQRTAAGIKAYYKLGYSTNSSDFYRNYAPAPGPGTDPASKVGSGNVGFPEVDDAGEQSLFDSRKNHGNDAATPLSGAFVWQQTAFARPVPGIAFDFRLGYSTSIPTNSPSDGSDDPFFPRVFGAAAGWRHTFETRVVIENNLKEAELYLWDGSVEDWTRTNTIQPFMPRHHEYRGELYLDPGSNEVFWTNADRLVYHFFDPTSGGNNWGRLRDIRDFNGNSVQVNWADSGYITNVVDSAGGIYTFNMDTNNLLLTNVTFGQWQINFSYSNSTGPLISKSLTNTSGLYSGVNTTWKFLYNTNGLLSQIVDARGIANTTVQYDKYGRQTNIVDALGRTNSIEYNVPAAFQLRRTDPSGFQWLESYDRKGHIVTNQDPLTNITSYTYDTNGNRTSVTEPLGWTTTYGYDTRANIIAKTNALGEVTTWLMHPFFNKATQQISQQPLDMNGSPTWTNFYDYDAGGNLINQSDGLGSLVSYTYSTNGLVLTSMDANTNTTYFGYDTNGFLNAKTDPASNTVSYTLNDVGWKLREVNALGDATYYAYNLNGNPTRIQDVIGRIFNRVYDPNGNLLSSTDGKLVPTTYSYDTANQKTNMTDRTGTNKWVYFYTIRGKIDHATDPLGRSTTNFYDAANRLVRVSDPLGRQITNQYDANGNLIFFFDKLGQRWTKTYDRLNRVTAETDPLGNTRTTTYDSADRIQQITSPNGYPSTHSYDGRGRLTKWVDPQNFPWLYAYDGNANITNITDALNGHYIMAYGNRNERILERNQDNFEWHYSYDELLRLKKQTDPSGIDRTPTYDPASRILSVDFSTGRRDEYVYDNNDNPTLIKRRYSGVTTATQFIYDSLDRVIEQDDALGKTVLYGYDALGRNTSITYPNGKVLVNAFDSLGRLTNQTDWASRQTTYTYDAADRLTGRTYPNGVVQTNTFDAAGRITSLSYSTLNSQPSTLKIALTYAYDRNGNKTGGGEIGTFNWPLPSLTDDQTTFTAAGHMKDRQTQNNSAASNQLSNIHYQYDPNGNMTNASGNGQSWGLTYDEDNRTTSINWDTGLTSKNITNRYDALGRRVSRTVDGATTGYVLSLAGGMERILCDLDADGNVTAWYVHGPDLCYKVDATNGLTCYHSDAMANIIALTAAGGTNIALYAYTPYGRSLGSTNTQLSTTNSQPFTFVGSQGVMEELPGLYFMRARYYLSDAATFLSTDPVKNMGPGYLPAVYLYADSNPLRKLDPQGMVGVLDAYGVGRDIYELWHPDPHETAWGRFFKPIISGGKLGLDLGLDLALDDAPEALKGIMYTLKVTSTTESAAGFGSDVIDATHGRGLLAGLPINNPGSRAGGQPTTTGADLRAGLQNAANTMNNSIPQFYDIISGKTGFGNSSANGSGNSQMCSYTASTVATHGAAMTAVSSTQASSSSSGSGTTSSGGGGALYCPAPATSGGGSSQQNKGTASQSGSTTPTSGSFASTISSALNSWFNFFSGYFGGGKK